MLFGLRVKQLTIANPCRESGGPMAGCDMQRFCNACNRSVYDLSALTRRQAAAPSCEVKVRVIDPTGAIIPKAIVKISKAADAEAWSSGTSNEEGEFSGRIAPGRYSLQVESVGFMSFRQELTCTTWETVSVDAPLQLGLLGEVVEVRSKPFPLLGKLLSLIRRR
jgi:hypothetical protein